MKFNTPTEIELIRKYYYDDNKSLHEIGKLMNCAFCTIYRVMKYNGFVLRPKSYHTKLKYTVNEDYFNVIDTPDKAYFLGLLYADGTINKKDKLVGIGLQIGDSYIIDTFVKYTEFSGVVRILKSKNKKHYDTSYVQIYNRLFYENAVKCGLYQNKSTTLTYPPNDILTNKLTHHFIRGYFDGDGCAFVNYKRKNHKYISFVGTFEFLSTLQNMICENLNINRTSLVRKSANNNFHLGFYKQSDVLLLINYLYNDKRDLYLIRKYHKMKL